VTAENHILALGGGGFLEEESSPLDDYALSLARSPRPKICFIATATGDNDSMILKFYSRFTKLNCEPTHLEMFRRKVKDLAAFLNEQDVIYVGGGNTANMLAIWRLHGLDKALYSAYSGGTVLTGVSAGSICWFEAGITDSFGPELAGLDCLGFLRGSNCPHYDGEAARRPAYHRMIKKGFPSGIAADNGVGLHFLNEDLHKVVASREEGRAYKVELQDSEIRETLITPELLQRKAG